MFHYPYFFTLKYHLHDKNTYFSPARFARILKISYYIVPGSTKLKHLKIQSLTEKSISVLLVLLSHLSYRLFIEFKISLFDVFLTTYSNDFVLGKALLSLPFPYLFSSFFQFLIHSFLLTFLYELCL